MFRYLLILACVVVVAVPGWAEKPTSPDQLAGSWTYAQRASNQIYVDSLVLKSSVDGLGGVMKYQKGGKDVQDIFGNFEFKSSGSVWFTSTRPNGRVVKHMGELSEDGNSISGSYNLGFGVGGPFMLTRDGVPGPPSMSAGWVYHVVDPEGGPGLYGDMTLLCDAGGKCEGYLDYRQSYSGPKYAVENVGGKQRFVLYKPKIENSKKVECTVAEDGSVELNIYENGTFVCIGKLTKDGLRVDGIWEKPEIGKGQFILSRAK